jgi:hypothetical protein
LSQKLLYALQHGNSDSNTHALADSFPIVSTDSCPVARADSAASGLRSWILVELERVLGHMRRWPFVSRANRAETDRW